MSSTWRGSHCAQSSKCGRVWAIARKMAVEGMYASNYEFFPKEGEIKIITNIYMGWYLTFRSIYSKWNILPDAFELSYVGYYMLLIEKCIVILILLWKSAILVLCIRDFALGTRRNILLYFFLKNVGGVAFVGKTIYSSTLRIKTNHTDEKTNFVIKTLKTILVWEYSLF